MSRLPGGQCGEHAYRFAAGCSTEIKTVERFINCELFVNWMICNISNNIFYKLRMLPERSRDHYGTAGRM